jgi:hypothetical protein
MAKAPEHDVFLQHLAAKHGTGISARADGTGNHMLAQSVIDSYAAKGQVVPASMQKRLQEMNQITQSEVLLSKASPGARVARMSAGYDPVGTQRRLAQMEMEVLTESADARTYAERLSNEQSAANVESLELANRLSRDTMDARIEGTRASLELETAVARGQKAPLDLAQSTMTILKAPGVQGKSTNDLMEIWAGNDPTMMQATFGTTDRVGIHASIRQLQLMDSEANAGRIEGMTKAANMQAIMLAADPAVTDDQLLAMASGQVPAEINGTKLSLLAIKGALTERTTAVTAQTAYTEAQTAGIVQAEELQDLGLKGLRMDQMSGTVAAMVGATPEAVLDALQNGRHMELADALYSVPAIAQNGGQLQIMGPSGQPMTVTVQAFVDSMATRYDERVMETATSLSNTVAFDVHMRELAETDKTVALTQSVMGQPMPAAASRHLQLLRDEARANITAAMRAPDQKTKDALLAQAMEAESMSRNFVANTAQSMGAPEYVVADLQQGRFSSETSLHAAQVDMLGYGAAGLTVSLFGNQMQTLMDTAKITPVQFQAWTMADPNAKIEKGAIHPASLEALGITKQDVVGMVEGAAYQVISNDVMEFVSKDPAFATIDPAFKAQLLPLLDGSLAAELNLAPAESLQRVMQILKIADEAQWTKTEAEAANGGPANRYQRGTLQKRVGDHLNQSKPLGTKLAGASSRADLALLSTYYAAKTGLTSAVGGNAPSFEDLPAMVESKLMKDLSAQTLGQNSTDLVALRAQASADVDRFTSQAGGTPLIQIPSQLTERDPQRRAVIESAIYQGYARRLAQPETFNSRLQNWLNPGVPGSPGGGYALISDEDLRSEITAMGLNPEDYIIAGGQ